jgi:Uma2 family endonuclease
MATVNIPVRRRSLVLPDTDWQTYTRLLKVFAERPAVRLTYDRGVLEIMSPLLEHDRPSEVLGRFVVVLTEELGLPLMAAGSTTLRFRRRQRGLEPDRSWWIANEPRMRGKRDVDLRVDPAPDLAVETDLTSSSLDRMGIYAALGVPEVWRLEGLTLTFQILGAGGKYADSPHSLAFPQITPGDLVRFLALYPQMDDNAVVREFRNWVRQNVVGGGSAPPPP